MSNISTPSPATLTVNQARTLAVDLRTGAFNDSEPHLGGPVATAWLQGPEAPRRPMQHHLLVDDPAIGVVSVRWFSDRELRWRCREHGDQSGADCAHTFSAALTLAEHLLGLTRIPELGPQPEGISR